MERRRDSPMTLTNFNTFMEVFGDISVGDVALVIAACVFLYTIYKKIQNTIIVNHDKEEERNQKLQQALDAISKYPQYRQQSINMQKKLQGAIDELSNSISRIEQKQLQIDEEKKKRDLNRLRNSLLQSYHYYTNAEKNPLQSWSEMEKEAFYNLFKDYENLGGNGYMHTTVQPAMDALKVVFMHEEEEVVKLMHSRK
jgi:energy-converting hydrogenase A subunit M